MKKQHKSLGGLMKTRNVWFSFLGLGIIFVFTSFSFAQKGILISDPVSGRSATKDEIISADVLARIQLVQEEIEKIRFEMGKPKSKNLHMAVTEASPREVYFQVMTLFQKVDQLCFEQTRQRGESPEISSVAAIRPRHVWQVANAALEQLRLVKEEFKLREKSQEKLQKESTSPTEVFQAIVQANRQLNLMLDQRFSPSDVFQQVSLAMSYTSSLLASFSEFNRIPDSPSLERGKRPVDVYWRLVHCFQLVKEIGNLSGLQILELNPRIDEDEVVEPSEVYDIASLVVSELAFFHSQLREAKPQRKVYYPGRKFPAHVYQRVGILEAQLVKLKKHVEVHPNWLKNEKTESISPKL